MTRLPSPPSSCNCDAERFGDGIPLSPGFSACPGVRAFPGKVTSHPSLKLRHYFLFLFSLSPTVSFLYPLNFLCASYFNIHPAGRFKELCKPRSPQDMRIGFQDRVLQLWALILCSVPCLLFRWLSKAVMASSPPPAPGM